MCKGMERWVVFSCPFGFSSGCFSSLEGGRRLIKTKDTELALLLVLLLLLV